MYDYQKIKQELIKISLLQKKSSTITMSRYQFHARIGSDYNKNMEVNNIRGN